MSWMMSKSRRLSMEQRMQQIAALLNKKDEVTLEDVIRELKVSITWAKRLMKAAEVLLPNVIYDDVNGVLKRVKEGE